MSVSGSWSRRDIAAQCPASVLTVDRSVVMLALDSVLAVVRGSPRVMASCWEWSFKRGQIACRWQSHAVRVAEVVGAQ